MAKEKPRKPLGEADNELQEAAADAAGDSAKTHRKKAIPGSTAFVPSVAGLIIAGEVLNDIAGKVLGTEETGAE